MRPERCREWTAEVSAILDDESIRPSWLRGLRALAFCAGISRAARQLQPVGAGPFPAQRKLPMAQRRAADPAERHGRPRHRRARVWVVVVAGIITVLIADPDPRGWPFLLRRGAGIGFDAYCLADIARASQVRYLSRRTWALLCLVQMPARRHPLPLHRPYWPGTGAVSKPNAAVIELNGLTKRSGASLMFDEPVNRLDTGGVPVTQRRLACWCGEPC